MSLRWPGVTAILAVSLLAARGECGEFNQVLNIGDPAPAWVDLPGTDGRTHSLADIPAAEFVVVVFTCNSCPVARDYEDRIMEFARRYAGRARVVAINVNTITEDRLDKMIERATVRKFNFTYLFDESQQIARQYGATGTPEFFLLSRASGGDGAAPPSRTILYMGAMDDHSMTTQVTKQYLVDALEAALAGGKPPVGETYAHGCRIRFARERRTE
jgi:peroxiredoxin